MIPGFFSIEETRYEKLLIIKPRTLVDRYLEQRFSTAAHTVHRVRISGLENDGRVRLER